jgi:hypothetical protein
MPIPRRATLSAGPANAIRLHRLLPLAGALALGLGACDGGATGAPGVGQVTLTAEVERLWAGRETPLVLRVLDESGNRLQSPQVAWSSSNSAVVTVHPVEGEPEKAVARGVGVGTASVIASVDGVRDEVPLQVEFGGMVRIDYSGGRDGRFLAGGPVPTDRVPREVTHTRAVVQTTSDMLILFGLQVHADGTSNWFQMQLPRSTTRRAWDFPVNCGGGERCTDWVGLVFNASWTGNTAQQRQYNARQGSVEVLEYSATRVRAEFSGSFATCGPRPPARSPASPASATSC